MIKQAAHHITLMVLSFVMANFLFFSIMNINSLRRRRKLIMASVKFKLQNQHRLQSTVKKKTYYGKCKIQTPKPTPATIHCEEEENLLWQV
jgi:hypothetical protein